MAEDKGLTRSQREEQVLQFWKENKIFEKTLAKESPKGDFVFYEGPPTANGRPGIHHIEARSFKDAIPRYKTMQGFHVPRKGGWDTHGLPVELEVQKQLGLKSKTDIEAYGVEKFNEECRKSVWKYVDEWQKFTDRIGYWVDLEHAYVTYHNSYIEKVWGVIAETEKQNLLYKDYKVVPWCPVCGTVLSSHELAQGYEDVKDLSLYVKFKVTGAGEILKSSGRSAQPDLQNSSATYLLAWTTTPWTLPGNVALAVGKDIQYVKIDKDGELLILAESRLSIVEGEYKIIEKMKGIDLVGLKYEPLYKFIENNGKAFQVYSADFVTTEDGTGIVHTAVMYGQEDFELGTKVGLPKVHLVNPDATFKEGLDWLTGRSVIDPELAVDILKDLKGKGFLFAKENYTHSYPHCWRSKNRLIYYARDSWYIRMSELRDKLVKENEKINWEPNYIKEGRFGDWLREVKDWAISRERYWGTPLPVWQNEEGKRLVVDSVETLKKYTKKSGNTYFVMRHGGTNSNKKEIVSFNKQAEDHLTEEGRKGVEKSAEALKNKGIEVIIASPFMRTRETAEIVRQALGGNVEVIFDDRLKEVNPGEFDGQDWHAYHRAMAAEKEWFTAAVPGGESLAEVLKRVGEFLYDLENKYKGQKILIVTHGGPAWLMNVASGEHLPEGKSYQIPEQVENTKIFVAEFARFKNAEVRELGFVPLPHDKNFQVDLHKPFIDEVVLEKDGQEYMRVKEVMDVWLDSGSMPFAQDPENVLYPADFISEAIDQTRGWFYTLHAVGTLMGRGLAFKNAICLGHILDKEGKKMSKSVGNVIDPWLMIEKYGVDALRLWMYSVNQPGESKNFDERSVEEIQKRIFNLLDNVYSFYELYRDPSLETAEVSFESSSILDKWILLRLVELTEKMTKNLDNYKLLEPVRDLRDFIDDLSTWYLRRSRDRLKEGNTEAKSTLYAVLKTASKLLAPFAPFAAEDLYQKLRLEADPVSVHEENWPMGKDLGDKNLLEEMKEVRQIVSAGLEARARAGIKIRQPLLELRIKNLELAQNTELLALIQDELNVKSVKGSDTIEYEVWLDTTLTSELLEEGRVRDIIRSLQEMRKEKNLKPSDILKYDVPAESKELFAKFSEQIKKAANLEL